ncbi:MAG: FHA domain-containing protein, partial [Cytophagales bacterium]|nr:FHA domain-containing protein [Armatimonadota bacterium]
APASAERWEAVAVVDPSLYVDPDPALPCPTGEPERMFPLDFAENLIGRRSERRAIYPEVDLSRDHGVSSRHAILYRDADGTLSLLDVGSTNGTRINDQEVTVGVRTPLRDGDQITIGCWTRITVRTVAARPVGGQQQP